MIRSNAFMDWLKAFDLPNAERNPLKARWACLAAVFARVIDGVKLDHLGPEGVRSKDVVALYYRGTFQRIMCLQSCECNTNNNNN